jgi:hypothetical protein
VDFDTTVEEMILYDMFGEDYDEVRVINFHQKLFSLSSVPDPRIF